MNEVQVQVQVYEWVPSPYTRPFAAGGKWNLSYCTARVVEGGTWNSRSNLSSTALSCQNGSRRSSGGFKLPSSLCSLQCSTPSSTGQEDLTDLVQRSASMQSDTRTYLPYFYVPKSEEIQGTRNVSHYETRTRYTDLPCAQPFPR